MENLICAEQSMELVLSDLNQALVKLGDSPESILILQYIEQAAALRNSLQRHNQFKPNAQ